MTLLHPLFKQSRLHCLDVCLTWYLWHIWVWWRYLHLQCGHHPFTLSYPTCCASVYMLCLPCSKCDDDVSTISQNLVHVSIWSRFSFVLCKSWRDAAFSIYQIVHWLPLPLFIPSHLDSLECWYLGYKSSFSVRLSTRSGWARFYLKTAYRPMTIVWRYFHTSICTSRRDGSVQSGLPVT